jgi:hypothetical protein
MWLPFDHALPARALTTHRDEFFDSVTPTRPNASNSPRCLTQLCLPRKRQAARNALVPGENVRSCSDTRRCPASLQETPKVTSHREQTLGRATDFATRSRWKRRGEVTRSHGKCQEAAVVSPVLHVRGPIHLGSSPASLPAEELFIRPRPTPARPSRAVRDWARAVGSAVGAAPEDVAWESATACVTVRWVGDGAREDGLVGFVASDRRVGVGLSLGEPPEGQPAVADPATA